MRKIGLLTMLMIAAEITASATTYYVDPAGNNANSGTSPQHSLADIIESWHFDFPSRGRHFV